MNEVVATSNSDYSSKASIIKWINDSLKVYQYINHIAKYH